MKMFLEFRHKDSNNFFHKHYFFQTMFFAYDFITIIFRKNIYSNHQKISTIFVNIKKNTWQLKVICNRRTVPGHITLWYWLLDLQSLFILTFDMGRPFVLQ